MNEFSITEYYKEALFNLESNLKNEGNAHNRARYAAEIDVVKRTLDALRSPQPDPITGLFPCGCGGKAYFEKTSDDLYPSKVTCSNCHMSTDYTSDDDRSRRDWNRAVGHKGGAE